MESTKVCMKCGKEIPAEFIFCPFCGADQTKNICKKCGATLLDGAVYCGVCGAKIESEAPVQSVQTESFVTPVQAENLATQPVASATEKVETSGDLSNRKQQNKRGVFDRSKVLSITKSAIILVFCIIMFGLAFGPTAKFKIYINTSTASGQAKTDYLSTVDGITLMNATARHYKQGKDDVKIDKLKNKLYEVSDEFERKLSGCYNEKTGRYNIDDDTAKFIGKAAIALQAHGLSFDEQSGSVESNNAIVFGLTSLLYILFASSMLICAIIYFVFTLTGRGKDIGKFVYALPMFLFFALALSFISGVFNKNANVVNLDVINGEVAASGVLIVTMLFSVMSTVAILVADAVKKTKSGYSVKKQAIKFLPVALILIVCACTFAPSAKSTLIAKTSNTQSEMFTTDFYNDFTLSSVLSKGEKEIRKEFFAGKTPYDEFDYYAAKIKKTTMSLLNF